ncbi:uncharacterized protein LAESUDRAFT_709692 [Laetiporus sulphureus 93-53]|uniref:C2H2-type domain-containing protein n=1 Tax=Laetiporus sulphureus 93-53 TaxID=1314785 RepID=A0A165ARS3_9APHY|nr:uncharacterized protein LAESUDRAFT_709695 [Laetiporus sulphureus 93-53]XP_040757307.1 uncharacterized protein LAESUDRAFT_709692 [Laetiporus sulphureus 93-53]KZS99534.1 hypothetical protein LAESUDRAFT_709695 [Laetiporus sulphureus 93-53]KZS99566.1 hypothetical protein LAESUDRAFT_709692 [Laetiporus sulphureus 93-53]
MFTFDNAIAYAQDVLHSIACEWRGCEATMNSWRQLQKHLKMHCQNQHAQGTYDCHFHKCAGRIHASFIGLWEHIKLSHLSRVTLLCPVSDCPHTFSGHHSLLMPHICDIHMKLVDRPMAENTGRLRPTYRPYNPVLQDLPPLPRNNIPIYMVTALPVSKAINPRGQRSEMLSKITQRSKKMSRKEQEEEDEEEEDAQLFDDLPNIDMEGINMSRAPILQPRSEQLWLQLSRPYSILSSRVEETKPAVSMGYGAFWAEFKKMEEAGLIDGAGEWPDAEEDE